MSDTILIVIGVLMSLFCLAWVTLFPVVGLLYMLGYLHP